MSAESAPPSSSGNQNMPEELQRFSSLDAKMSKDGRRLVYGVNARTGQKVQLKGDDVLDAYGYSPDEAQMDFQGTEPATSGESDEPNSETTEDEKVLRPVEEGELTDGLKDDDLPMAAMGHEPWTLDIKEDDKKPGGVFDIIKDPEDPKSPEDPDDPSSGITPGSPPVDELHDPRGKIGEVINQRIDELKEDGSTEADAHAEAHDEFWGRSPEASEPIDDDPSTPEGPTSPELIAANEAVDEARTELARLRAGRESATFFSRKFSKKKLEAAFERYEEAKAEAGAIAVDLLREQGLEGDELVSAINYGSMQEVTKLIQEQYGIEKEKIEGKRLKRFYDWWNKQGTKFFSFGTVKKGMVMAAIGIPLGVGAAVVAAPLLGAAGLGAGAGLAVARSVSKGLVGNTIRRNAEAGDAAHAKAVDRHQRAKGLVDRSEEASKPLMDSILNDLAKRQTIDTKHGNDRRAATAMAVGAGGAILGYMAAEGVAHIWPGGSPNPPEVPYDSAEADRFSGLVTARPGAPQEAQQFFGSIKPGTEQLPTLSKIDEIWNGVKDQLSPDESRVYNQVVGRLSTTPNFGNDWTVMHADELLNLVKDGNDTNEIIGLLGAGPQNL